MVGVQYGAVWLESVGWRLSPLLSLEQGGELAEGRIKKECSEEREGQRRG